MQDQLGIFLEIHYHEGHFILEVSLLVIYRSRHSLEQYLLWGKWLTLGGAGLMVLIFGLVGPEQITHSENKNALQRVKSFEKMLTGPLALRENSKSPLVLSLESKLVFLAQSARPDLKKKDRNYCIGVKGKDVQKIVKEGEPICVNLALHSSGGVEEISFIEDGQMRLIPHVLDNQSLLLRLEGFDEQAEIFLHAGIDSSLKGELDMAIIALENANWWGKDCFFQEYGGEKYKAFSEKEQIEIVSENLGYFLYVGERDFLIFRDGQWRVLNHLEEAEREEPLAQIKSITNSQIEIEAWDSEGFALFRATLFHQDPPHINSSLDQVIREPKMRNENQISCRVGKKHCLLKRGDWLIQKKNHWHKLKKKTEIKAFLAHELRGELFVIDDIDAHGIMQGIFFDETRTQSQKAQTRIPSSKSNRNKRKR